MSCIFQHRSVFQVSVFITIGEYIDVSIKLFQRTLKHVANYNKNAWHIFKIDQLFIINDNFNIISG